MLKRFLKRLSFSVCWWISSAMNFIWAYALRHFYLTDDLSSDYFREVAGFIDNWVFFVFGFFCLLLTYMLNTFYQEDLRKRFLFITSQQLMVLAVINILTAGSKVRLQSTFQLTWYYFVIWLVCLAGGLYLYNYVKRLEPNPLSLFKKLFKLKRNESYW